MNVKPSTRLNSLRTFHQYASSIAAAGLRLSSELATGTARVCAARVLGKSPAVMPPIAAAPPMKLRREG
jgi:hypothetical protein